MQDYSDLIFLIAAIAIYGLLVNNTSRSLVMNKQILTDSEIEYGAISVAQDVLEEVRWMQYEDFTSSKKDNTIYYLEGLNDNELFESDISITDVTSGIGDKKVEVTVTSNFLKNEDDSPRTIRMSMIKTNY